MMPTTVHPSAGVHAVFHTILLVSVGGSTGGNGGIKIGGVA
jgi:hypothetical protein